MLSLLWLCVILWVISFVYHNNFNIQLCRYKYQLFTVPMLNSISLHLFTSLKTGHGHRVDSTFCIWSNTFGNYDVQHFFHLWYIIHLSSESLKKSTWSRGKRLSHFLIVWVKYYLFLWWYFVHFIALLR